MGHTPSPGNNSCTACSTRRSEEGMSFPSNNASGASITISDHAGLPFHHRRHDVHHHGAAVPCPSVQPAHWNQSHLLTRRDAYRDEDEDDDKSDDETRNCRSPEVAAAGGGQQRCFGVHAAAGAAVKGVEHKVRWPFIARRHQYKAELLEKEDVEISGGSDTTDWFHNLK